jgi:hypothetical protein
MNILLLKKQIFIISSFLYAFNGIAGAQTLTGRGATLPFVVLEAEEAATNATVLPYSTTYKTDIQSEASGRRAVRLQNSGDYVQFTITAEANALVLRYAIPDNDNATFPLAFFINNNQQPDLTLDSKHSWVYGNYPYNNNAGNGNAHKFWEEKRIILPQTINAGTTLKFQKNANCNAQYYCIDLLETQQIAAATAQPANAVAVSGYNTLQDAVDAAINGGKILFIPEGEKNFPTGRANVWKSLTVQGAGAWRSVISGGGARFFINNSAENIVFKDFTIRGAATHRIDGGGQTAIESDNNGNYSNITAENLWLEHTEVGFWMKKCNNLIIKNCRIRNLFADGINLNNGCKNSIIEHNHIRNTGDDGIALWSENTADENIKIRFNTVELPSLANGIAVYGGANNEVENNIIKDIVFQGSGINLGTDHSPASCTGTMKAANNTLLRCGSIGDYSAHIGAIWINVPSSIAANIFIENNDIFNPTSQGIFVKGTANLPNILVKNNIFNSISTNAIHIMPECNGAMTAQCNTFTDCSEVIYKQAAAFNFSENNIDCQEEEEEEEEPVENIITIKIKTPSGWTNCNAYIWGTSELEGGWSGKSLSKEDGFYSYSVNIAGIAAANLLFNNGTDKIADIDIIAHGTSCWEAGEQQATDEHGNKIHARTKIECQETQTKHIAANEAIFTIFPNPTDGELIIKNEHSAANSATVSDVSGKIICTLQLLSSFNSIDVSHLQSGIYFIKIGNHTEKFIKK